MKRNPAHLFRAAVIAVLAAGLFAGSPLRAGSEPADARSVFEVLKALEGTWKGEGPEVEGQKLQVEHVFRVSANGSVVQEIMNPGTAYEMINMYHLDGDRLLMTHYCAGGNQPRMRLAQVGPDARDLRFVYVDGTNLDPRQDEHIHEGRLRIKGRDELESGWISHAEGVKAGEMVFHLRRVR